VEGAVSVKLSVIIPAFNEETRIGPTLDQLDEYLSGQEYASEVLVVNDGSSDKTAETVLKRAETFPGLRLIENDRNRGKGYTVKQGVTAAHGAHLLFFDADASTPIHQIEKFWPWFEKGFDVCIGSRSLPDSDVVVHQPKFREMMGRVFNLMVRILAVRGFIDTQCGFKAFTRAAAETIFPRQTLSGFGFDVELLFIAKKHGMTVREVPIQWFNSPDSRVHPFYDASKMFLELATIRLKSFAGRYR
jgi:dolichyl-phosphate beta-glucosyltransferase